MTKVSASDSSSARLVIAVLDALADRGWDGRIVGSKVYVQGLGIPLEDFATDFSAAFAEMTALILRPRAPLPKPQFLVTPSYPSAAQYRWELDPTERSG
jgi:hypothetical protein